VWVKKYLLLSLIASYYPTNDLKKPTPLILMNAGVPEVLF
jgi:hypothetical protein